MESCFGEALPVSCTGPSARKEHGPQDDSIVVDPSYFFGLGSSAGLM